MINDTLLYLGWLMTCSYLNYYEFSFHNIFRKSIGSSNSIKFGISNISYKYSNTEPKYSAVVYSLIQLRVTMYMWCTLIEMLSIYSCIKNLIRYMLQFFTVKTKILSFYIII